MTAVRQDLERGLSANYGVWRMFSKPAVDWGELPKNDH